MEELKKMLNRNYVSKKRITLAYSKRENQSIGRVASKSGRSLLTVKR